MRSIVRTAAKVGIATASVSIAGTVALAAAAGAVATSGPVTIVDPTTNVALAGPQASAKQFAANVPSPSLCPGSTASNGYHVFSFMVPAGTDPSTVSFSTGVPSTGLGYFDTGGNYQGPINTSTTGQVLVPSAGLTWVSPALGATGSYTVTDLTGGSTKTWDSGWACADTTGAVQKYWDQQITFTTSTTDAKGFTWTPVANVGANAPEVPLTIALPLGGAAVLGTGAFVNRRRSSRASATA